MVLTGLDFCFIYLYIYIYIYIFHFNYCYVYVNVEMMTRLKIATLNVRGMNQDLKRKSLFKWANNQHIDILCLQETVLTKPNVTKFLEDW